MTTVASQFGVWSNRAQPNFGTSDGGANRRNTNTDGRVPLPVWGRVVDRSRTWQDLLGSHEDTITVPAVSATLSATLADATLVADAVVAVEATLAATLADATLNADAVVAVEAMLAATLENATLNADAVASIQASLSKTLADATLNANAVVAVEAALASTLADATLDADAVVGTSHTATLSATLMNATLAANAVVTGGPIPPTPGHVTVKIGGGVGFPVRDRTPEQVQEKLLETLCRIDERLEHLEECQPSHRNRNIFLGLAGSLLLSVLKRRAE